MENSSTSRQISHEQNKNIPSILSHTNKGLHDQDNVPNTTVVLKSFQPTKEGSDNEKPPVFIVEMSS